MRVMALNAYDIDGSKSLCKEVSLNAYGNDGSERLCNWWL